MMIYCKSFKYASNAEKQFSESDIINFSQVDAEKMTDMGFQMACLLLTPLQIVAGIAMMYWFIGISFLAGIGVMLLMIGFTFFLMKYVVKYNEAVLKVKDQRMKVTQ
jgi:membrane protein YdbS with pleckstrin-like domain